ncbi:MAG: porphobilinogen synthase [Planctomycetaceae bacterium]|nr:porphobilinogen synthase [Planctomycetaceae bacterium]
MGFPITRMRRLRTSEAIRRLVRDTSLSRDDLVYPLFVCPGNSVREPITSLTGCFHLSPDEAAKEARAIADAGIPAVLLFGLPERKDAEGSSAWTGDPVVCQAIRQIKKAAPELAVITDVCLCAYTDHGHCGLLQNGRVDNDSSLEALSKMALCHARAGADIVAPSDMMDGRVLWIRRVLDAEGFKDTAILSYSAKFASAFYGPFRDAACSAPSFGDRRSYQMDSASARQAMREIELDIEEGADIVMIKPAMAYLDMIHQVRQRFDVPLAAYHVSGEYMMIKAAAEKGLLDGRQAMIETLTAIKRAGADFIITYFAKEAAEAMDQ